MDSTQDSTWEDTTLETTDSGDENVNPNVTIHRKLRSGIVASKDGTATKYLFESTRESKRIKAHACSIRTN